jgi:DNA polymerase III subunit gamma/tau
MTLYLKYRPQTIDELDLGNVRETLTNIINSGNIPHAFLFSGPKGTGKTSAARILAKVINCENLGKNGEPCNKCSSCLSIINGSNIDVIELDAASNRGIDDIRSLKEGIYLSPASAKKKVYIIDEVHMLTLEAANAFLKTLEEPPDHVVFILATTNPEKLPETVISRLTRINFTKASDEDVARQLNRVAKGEEIKITPAAIKLISKKSDGSFRDAVKILESLSFKSKDITEDDIKEESFDNFFEILEEKNAKKSLEFIENLIQNGTSIRSFTEKLLISIHESILAKNAIGEDKLKNFELIDLVSLSELLNEAKKVSSPISQLPLEIAVVKFCGVKSKQAEPVDEIKIEIEKPAEEADEVKVKVKEKKKVEPVKELDDAIWIKLLENVREKNVSIEALLRSSKPLGFDGKTLELGLYYQFHKERLEDIKNKKLIEDICRDTFGLDLVKLSVRLIDKPASSKKEILKNDVDLNTKVGEDIIDAAKEIFG